MGRHASSARRHDPLDPESSDDPNIRRVVAGLRAAAVRVDARPEFRAELRLQLVAIAPRLIAEGGEAAAVITGPAKRASARSFLPGRRRSDDRDTAPGRSKRRHPVALVAGTFTVLVALLAGAVWLSSSAKPGEALYGLKRASENAQMALSGDTGVDKGRAQLLQASERAGEVDALLSQPTAMGAGFGTTSSGAVNSHTASLVTSTLNSADSDLRSGTATITRTAVTSRQPAGLALIEAWSPSQRTTLTTALGRVPAGALHDRINSSLTLLGAADARARALATRLSCPTQPAAPSDQFGPTPVAACGSSSVRPSVPGTTTRPGQPGSSVSVPSTSTSSGSSSGGSTPTGSVPTGSVPTGSLPGSSVAPGLPKLPGLPTGSKLAPAGTRQGSAGSTTSCATVVVVGGVSLSVGGCTGH